MPRGGWVERLFRIGLRLLPAWFGDLYADDLVETFREGRADAVSRGAIAGAAYSTRAFVGLPIEAWRLRCDGPQARWAGAPAQAIRSLRRAPGWSAACLLLLTLGIGGTTAVFSVLNAVLLRDLPFEEPDRLVSLWTVNQTQGLPDGSSWENANDWLERGNTLEDVALVVRPEFTAATVTSFGEPERIHVAWVSANFFELLGVNAAHGELFGAQGEDAGDVAVIDEALWTTRFGRTPDVLGQTIEIDGTPHQIIGVAPTDLTIPLRETRVWGIQPVRTPAGQNYRGWDAYWAIGRLADGVTVEHARADLGRVAEALAAEYPLTNRNRGVSVTALRDEIVGPTLPLLLWSLMGSMVLVLLIGTTNVAQLMISRGVRRRREVSIRASLGASWGEIRRQLIIESALLALVASVTGVALAYLGLDLLLTLVPPDVPLTEQVRIDGSVLALAVGVSCLLGPAVGALPALAASRVDLAESLRGGGRGATAGDRRARSLLVAAEVAMAVVLLGSAGLLVRSAVELGRVDPGFEARGALVAQVDFGPVEEGETHVPVHEALLEAMRRIPGVHGAGTIDQLFVKRFPDQTITLVGEEPRAEGEPSPRLTTDPVSPGFFEELGIPLLRGRGLEYADIGDINRPMTFLVNQAWVRTFSPDQDPIGRQFRWGDQVEGVGLTVVGVVGDLRRSSLEEVAYPQMFIAGGPRGAQLVVRADDPTAISGAVRAAVREVDPVAAVSNVTVAWDLYQDGLSSRRFQTFVLGAFAFLATLLSAFGLFAILHDNVASRRREIGVRIALGARPGGVRRRVIGQGLSLVGVGLGVGFVALLLLSGVTARFLYGVSSADPITMIGVAVLVSVVAFVASAAPAVSATRVSPLEVLTEE